MNDNFIKMFIGGEEVVSNKEFTINEEMLSASSTILNNCYPASWEESKDYVSNFYYPKDYSKFILGKGNFTYGTDQYSILSVSGETFMQFTTNVEKEWNSFNVYGSTYQKTSILPNEYTQVGYIESTGVEYIDLDYIFNEGDIIELEFMPLEANVDKAIFGAYEAAGKICELGFLNNLLRGNISTTDSQSYSINTTYKVKNTNGRWRYNDNGFGTTMPNTMSVNCYLFARNYNGVTKKSKNRVYSLKITRNNAVIHNYIPCYRNSDNEVGMYDIVSNTFYTNDGTGNFIYGGTSIVPSPDYPSELVSVGYSNSMQNPTSTVNLNNGYYIDSPTNIQITQDMVGKYVNIAYDIDIKSLSTTGRVTSLIGYGSNASIMRNEFTTGRFPDYSLGKHHISYSTRTITQEMVGKYLIMRYIRFITISSTVCDVSNIIINIANEPMIVDYIPYGKYGIKVKTTGKNLFDIENANWTLFNASYPATFDNVNNGWYNKAYMEISFTPQEIETFSFYVKKRDLESGEYNYSGKWLLRKDGTTVKYDTGGDSASYVRNTYTMEANHTYLFSVYNHVFINNMQIEKGNAATTFEAYKENSQLYTLDEPLRAIGDIKDRLYIENGMLYVDRKIGSIVLNGSENGWNDFRDNQNHYNYYIYREDIAKTVISCLSNYFKYTTAGTNQINEFQIGGYNPNKNGNIIFNPFNDTTSDLPNFKNWLSTHNTEVQYPLEEPYVEEIGQVLLPSAYNGINNIFFYTGLETTEDVYYYWKNYDILFAGIVKNSGDISLRPTNPKYCSLQILDYKTFLSESDTLDFVISDKTIAEAISMVVDAISGYGFVLGTINISQADDIIGAYSTLNKTAYDVFQYLANISGSRWRARFVDSDTMAIDFYDPELLPRANDIDYTQQYWEDNKIVDLTFNYGTRDYRNKQIILSDEVYGGIDYTEVLLSNGYGTSYITQNNIANITSITVNGIEAEVITQSEKDLGVDADFYYTPGKNVVESTTSYTAGTQIIITYTPLVKGRQIVYNDEEVTRIATQTNTTGVISRYENRNDILSSDELENIAESYIKYKGKPEIILKLTTLNNDLFNIGEICYFNSPIADLAQDYMVKSKATNYTSVAGETNIFYTYELTSSFNSEKAINYFDNQRNKATGNIAEGESITRNIDINNSAMIIWENATITEISVSVDGDNALNSVLNSPFIQ